jgi:hypothetical protein
MLVRHGPYQLCQAVQQHVTLVAQLVGCSPTAAEREIWALQVGHLLGRALTSSTRWLLASSWDWRASISWVARSFEGAHQALGAVQQVGPAGWDRSA